MMKSLRWILSLVTAMSAAGVAVADDVASAWSESQHGFWQLLAEELEVQELLQRASTEHRPTDFLIRNVAVVDVVDGILLQQRAVRVADGRIKAIHREMNIDPEAGLQVIDGTGHYLMPGLTDMHSHNLTSHSQHLLNLLHGVTTVRDLDGFPFLLAMRDAINAGQLLAPSMYVSGTILNSSGFGGYARVVTTPDQARAAVREQVDAGYDFIKTHNGLASEVFDAIASESRKQGIDLVGHIPVRVSIEQAVARGMRTFEHFKGYIKDNTLTLTGEDYVSATRGARVWNVPTFVNYRNQLRGEDAATLLANERDMRWVSPRDRKSWQRFKAMEPDRVTRLRQQIYPLSRQIFGSLRESLPDAQFLAGTDAGSYEMMPPGVVLQEEIRIFAELGMSNVEALRTATTNPAEAMRRPGEFGQVRVGGRADLVLLKANPLQSLEALSTVAGVAVRGVWISQQQLEALAVRLFEVFDRSSGRMSSKAVSMQVIDDYLVRLIALHEAGFVFRDHDLELAAGMFGFLGRGEDAIRIRCMKIDPAFGFSFMRFAD